MTHDPLCQKYFHPYAAGFSYDNPCTICALIFEIREHERTSADALIGKEYQWESGRKYGFSEGLHAARETIEAVDPPSEAYDDWYPKGKSLALDAIDAMRDKS